MSETAGTTRIIRRRMRWRAMRYALTFIGPALALVGFLSQGWLTWALVIHAFVMIPLLELALPPHPLNLTAEEEDAALHDRFHDGMLYALVPVQWALLLVFLFRIQEPGLSGLEIAGRTVTMGLMCGVYGINVAHELGHRARGWERDLARVLLLSSLYMHFIIEHNRGHHRRVATPGDPASARYGESVYRFWARTIVFSLLSAWAIERERLIKEGVPVFSWRNEMIRSLLIEIVLVAAIGVAFGSKVLLLFLVAAFIGVLLLETVNYIEHYGLQRVRGEHGAYGRVQHYHSWNSDHPIGRLMLFELTRHSDHHWRASKKYQVLRSMEEGPQLPTGYPGMMLLSLVPPVWFRVVHPQLHALAGRYDDLTLATGAGAD